MEAKLYARICRRDRHGPCLHGSYSLEEKTVINQLIPSVMNIKKGEEESAVGSIPHWLWSREW